MIRELKREDKAIFLQLSKEFFSSNAVLYSVPEQFHEDAFCELLRSDEYAKAYILEVNDVAVGYGMTATTYSREAGGKVLWLEELYIREGYRGQGLGKEFFTETERYAKQHGYARIRLEVEEDNLRAKKLYFSLGYKHLDYMQMCKELRYI